MALLALVGLFALALWWFGWRHAASAPAALPPPGVAAAPAAGSASTLAVETEELASARHPVADTSPAVPLRGTVHDDGGPVADATVRWFAEPRKPEDAPLGTAATEGDGVFAGEARVGPQARLAVVVTAAEHEDATASVAAGQRWPVFRMTRLVTVSGRVCEEGTGAPIAGATVADDRHSATTDAEGRYTLRASIAVRRARLSARAPGFAEARAELRAHAARADLDFTLQRALVLTFLVVDRDSGAPIASAEARGDSDAVIARAGADGRLRVDCGAGQPASLRVFGEGHASLRWTWEAATALATTPRLPLARVATIAGRVVGASGQGIAGASVDATNEAWVGGERGQSAEVLAAWALPGSAADEPPAAMSAKSGSDGRFALTVASDPNPYVLRAVHDDWVTATSTPVTVARGGDRAEVEVRLAAAGTVVGRVTRGGQPLRREVRWRSEERYASGSAITEVDGSYRLRRVPPGRVVVEVREPTGRRLGEATIDVVAGQETRWDLAAEELPGAIRGRVTRPDGTPLAGIAVRASTVQEEILSYLATTGDDGGYVLRCAEGPTYSVRISYGEFSDTRDSVAAHAAGVDFVLPDFGLLTLQLVDAANGSPLRVGDEGPWTFAWRRSGAPAFQEARNMIDSSGRIEAQLPQGRVDVSVSLPRSGFAWRLATDLTVTDAERPAALPLALVRGVTWEVAVVGEPPFSPQARAGKLVFLLAEAQVSMLRGPFAKQGGESNYRVGGVNLWMEDPNLMNQLLAFDDRGVASLRGLAPGRYTLRVFPDDMVFEPGVLEVGTQDGRSEVHWRPR